MALPVSMCVTEFWAKTTSSNCWRPDPAASRPMQPGKLIALWNSPTLRTMDRGTQSGGSLSTTSVAFHHRAGQRWKLVWLSSVVPEMSVKICSSCWLGPYLSWVGKESTGDPCCCRWTKSSCLDGCRPALFLDRVQQIVKEGLDLTVRWRKLRSMQVFNALPGTSQVVQCNTKSSLKGWDEDLWLCCLQ